MKKLLLASFLMMVGTAANAAPVASAAECTGTFPDITCVQLVVCAGMPAGKCDSSVLDSAFATCATSQGGKLIGALNTGAGASGAFCTWEVTDTTDNVTDQITIDGSVGLPVELQSMSVE